jgi:hypothetical protein
MIRKMAIVLVATVAGALLAVAPARAADFVSCQGTVILGFEPGLLEFNPQTVNMSARDQGVVCESSVPGLQFAKFDTTVENIAGLSCTSLLVSQHDATTLHWNGSTVDISHFTFDVTIEMVLGQMLITFTGNIDSGRFMGATTSIAVTAAQPSVTQCLSAGGETGASGASLLTILDLS